MIRPRGQGKVNGVLGCVAAAACDVSWGAVHLSPAPRSPLLSWKLEMVHGTEGLEFVSLTCGRRTYSTIFAVLNEKKHARTIGPAPSHIFDMVSSPEGNLLLLEVEIEPTCAKQTVLDPQCPTPLVSHMRPYPTVRASRTP